MKFMRFREWLDSHNSEKDKKIQEIWTSAFKALGVDGMSKEDAAQLSLSKINFGHSQRGDGDTFKGKEAARKRLEQGHIFQQLLQTQDPEVAKGVEAARKWLGQKDAEHSANGSTTVSNLLRMMFGEKHFQQFIGQDFPSPDTAKAEVQPQAPKPGSEGQSPNNSMGPDTPSPNPTSPPNQTPGQQPQAPGGMMPPQPSSPLPPKPAGAEFGMF
jgi:hypothetical protein